MRVWTVFCVMIVPLVAQAGEFTGDLVLFPEGCQNAPDGICKLGAELTYRSSRDEAVWQTDVWSSDSVQSGTTDGASIPGWAQPIIGEPFDAEYLKAAIVHDHYCYDENNVRPWRQTHLMFYDALIDLGVSSIKAKTMYFAVYLGGPKWIDLVPGENCGDNCIKNFSASGKRYDSSELGNPAIQAEVVALFDEMSAGLELDINELEERAEGLAHDKFYFENGATYKPVSESDPNLLPRL